MADERLREEQTAEPFISDDVEIAERALTAYGLSPDSTLRLLNLSENATYAVADPHAGTQSILRVHRKGYHRATEIESELDWLDALRKLPTAGRRVAPTSSA